MSRRVTACLCATIALLLAPCVEAGCELPAAPSKIPNGAMATEDDIRTTMRTLARYDTDLTNYLKCLAFEVRQGRMSRQEQAVRHNAAIDRQQTLVARFNEQMKIFMAR
jgi:hypothetical protein